MEFLRVVKRRSLFSELIYILLNVGLAVAILLVVWAVESPLPAFVLVVLSKWRILAVRPRYWFAHVQSNMVDLIVSVGLVVILSAIGNAMGETGIFVQIGLTFAYIAWLLVLKPRTKRSYVIAQAGVAQAVGVTALYMSSYEWSASVVVLLMWLIGYTTARHVLSAYSESQLTFLSLAWGFVVAQIGWLTYHWSIAYRLPGIDGVLLPQVAIIIVAIGFLAERFYGSYVKHGSVRTVDVVMPTLLSLSVLIVILTLFNSVSIGTS